MSDPRTDPLNDPRRPAARRRLENDSGGSMWPWIVGIVAVIVVAMMVYGYNKPVSTAGNPPPTNSSTTTTGAAPTLAPTINPPASAPIPAPAAPVPAPAETPR